MADFNPNIGNFVRDVVTSVKDQVRDAVKENRKAAEKDAEKAFNLAQEGAQTALDTAKAANAAAKKTAAALKSQIQSQVSHALNEAQQLNKILQPRPEAPVLPKSNIPSQQEARKNSSQPPPSNQVSEAQKPPATLATQRPTGPQSSEMPKPLTGQDPQGLSRDASHYTAPKPPQASQARPSHGAAYAATTGAHLAQQAVNTSHTRPPTTTQPHTALKPFSHGGVSAAKAPIHQKQGQVPKKLAFPEGQNPLLPSKTSPPARTATAQRATGPSSSPKTLTQQPEGKGAEKAKAGLEIFNFGEKLALPEAVQELQLLASQFLKMTGEVIKSVPVPANAAAALAEKKTTVGEIGKNISKMAEEGGEAGKEGVVGLMTHFVQGMRRNGRSMRF